MAHFFVCDLIEPQYCCNELKELFLWKQFPLPMQSRIEFGMRSQHSRSHGVNELSFGVGHFVS